MNRKISEYFEAIFLKFEYGFRKDYGTIDCHGRKLQKDITLEKGIWCFAN